MKPKICLHFLLMTALVLSGSVLVYAEKPASIITSANPVIAVVDSKPITMTDIENKEINELRSALYERLNRMLRKKALESLGSKYAEFNKEPEIKITDKEMRGFYRHHDLEQKGSFEQLAPQIRAYLEAQVQAQHYDNLFNEAIKRGLVVNYLQKPNEFLVKAPVETAYLRGDKSADLMVLEFSDYQCPFCYRVQSTISSLRKKYKSTVVFAYRHSPLPFHYEADEAAIAVECARDQGKFESYHDLLFQNYRNITIPNLRRFAEQAGIKDQKGFNDCLDKEKYRPRLENDQKAAKEIGIKGTPGFIIGRYHSKEGVVIGEVLSGAQSESSFVALIEKYLAQAP